MGFILGGLIIVMFIGWLLGMRKMASMAMLDLHEPHPAGMQSRVRTARRAGDGGVDLRKRRRWFAEGDDTDAGGDSGNATIDLNSLDPAVRAYIEERENRIKELNHESASRRHALTDLEKKVEALTQAQRDKLEKDGEYKPLYEQTLQEVATLRMKAERAEAYEQQIKAQNESMIAQVPDAWKDAIPDLPPEKLSTWLQTNMPKFTTPKAPALDGGRGGGGGDPITLTAEQEIAYKSGRFENKEEFMKYMKKAGLV